MDSGRYLADSELSEGKMSDLLNTGQVAAAEPRVIYGRNTLKVFAAGNRLVENQTADFCSFRSKNQQKETGSLDLSQQE